MLTTAQSGGNGGDSGGNTGGTGNTGNGGNNISAPSGNNQLGNNQTGTTPIGGSGSGSVATNVASTRNNGRDSNLPKTGEVASAFALLGFGAVGTALASWLKHKKNN